jgi:hypothetical protein
VCSLYTDLYVDKKVKIWATPPILDAESDEIGEYNRLLCTITAHTGQSDAVQLLPS